ncbi:MAG TPA: type VI secretion system tip protein TssI/VgrG, partial [Polyangium sp.]|nr:type VI secretion system tip protein TssI/VgrG [Polyangium sp.]
MNTTFEIVVEARTSNEALDFDALVGCGASFHLQTGTQHVARGSRTWTGICSHVELLQAETTGLSTYRFTLAPRLWLLGRRTGYRVFQHQNIPAIVVALLTEWRVETDLWLDRESHPRLPMCTQYGESDLVFVSRLLEDAGIAAFFRENEDGQCRLVLSDRAHGIEPRGGGALHYVDHPNQSAEREFVTEMRLAQQVASLRHTVRDVDHRRDPGFALFGQAAADHAIEGALERYEYAPGAFAIETNARGDTPMADDKAAVRHDEKVGRTIAERRVDEARASRHVLSFKTNAPDLAPGTVFLVEGHPHPLLDARHKWLVTEFQIEGAVGEEWIYSGKAASASAPYRPPRQTPKPVARGVESALVVGPKGEEIHTDEFGRVRIQFPWDRQGQYDDASSCWVRVSQGWAGAGFGLTTIPRVGQEVLVGFFGSDPDQPVVIGRLYDGTNPVPYKLPENKAVTGLRTATSPRTGGYNELRFDDTRGSELVHVQAERNLTKVVKLDETETTGQTRVIECGKRLILTTGQASIILDGPHIFIEGDGEIVMNGGPVELEEDDTDDEDEEVEDKLPPDKHGKEVYQEGIAIDGSPSFRAKTRAVLDKVAATNTGEGL